MKNYTCIILILLLFLASCKANGLPLTPTVLPTPATPPFMRMQLGGGSNLKTTPESSGQQIAFSVKGGTFTYLKIEGTDRNGQWKTWQTNSKTGLTLAMTTEYWWKGTVVLVFDIVNVGQRSCVIDYLREATGSTMAAIIYTEGKGCSGEGGSARRAGSTQVLIEYMDPQDARKIVEGADFAYNATGCVQGIANGFARDMWGKS